jgi:metaxin
VVHSNGENDAKDIQAFLKVAGVEHKLISSNNHASPTCILPFLIPAVQDGGRGTPDSLLPIPSNKLVKYVSEKGGKVHEPDSVRYEAYQSLLDNRIRNAWVR